MNIVRLCLLSLLLVPLVAQQPAPRRPFTRMVENEQGGRLEILIADYQKGDARLTLFGCVHVADVAFYQGMQQRFEQCDALLYELVGPADLRPYPGMALGEDEHWISMVQGGMANGLRLADQFEAMDYRHDNFVHADMTEDEWQDALAEAGKSELAELLTIGSWEVDREAEAKQRKIDLVSAFRSGRGVAELRIVVGRSMLEGDATIDQPTVVIHGRNEKCLAVLEQQLALGKQRIGIFYGAAHMEHLEHRLTKDLGWRHIGEQWVEAWDCRFASWPKQERGLKRKRYRARRDLEKLLALARSALEQHGARPSWLTLRACSRDGRLPGRNDGVDPWGRGYMLNVLPTGIELRCLGSDGKPHTEDDLVVGPR